MKVISENNLSLAWLKALEHLLGCVGGKMSHLIVGIENVDKEDLGIRYVLDDFSIRKNIAPVSSVANTIFPISLYHPNNPKLMGSKARYHLYQMYRQGNSVRQRLPANKRGTYFNRMIDWTSGNSSVNQIDRIIERLQKGLTQKKSFSSIYEMNMGGSDEYTFDDTTAVIRICRPDKDTSIRGFPCLSHISLTLHEGRLDMNAIYRNQYFIHKAYGNYLGLGRLLQFICREVGCEAGELVCLASHADAELGVGKRDIEKLIRECEEVSQSSQVMQC